MSTSLFIKTPLHSNFSSILVGSNVLQRPKGQCVIVSEPRIAELYGIRLSNEWNAPLLTISNEKTKEVYEQMISKLFEFGCDRETTLVALGGGTICDLVGFVASTFMRGIPLILIPTTLLAMVDAAIGGKVAIDTPFGKNLIGSFYFPEKIFVDFSFLSTLPDEEWVNGFAEVLKMGLICEPSLWFHEFDTNLIEKAIRAKISVVEKDPEENGLRRILNFGHTIGHGLEKIDRSVSHGRAVALGIITEAHLSMTLGFLSKDDFENIVRGFKRFVLKIPENYTRDILFEKMRHDKKKKEGSLRFVFIDKIGGAVPFDGNYCSSVSENELKTTLDWFESNYG